MSCAIEIYSVLHGNADGAAGTVTSEDLMPRDTKTKFFVSLTKTEQDPD